MSIFRTIDNSINSLLGSNKTHVVNAYRKPVFLTFTSEEIDIRVTLNKWKPELDLRRFNWKDIPDWAFGSRRRPQTIQVMPKSFHCQQRDNASDYMSVMVKNDDGTDNCLLTDFQIRANRSYIIRPDGQVVLSKYRNMFQDGDSDIWEDEYGNRYD